MIRSLLGLCLLLPVAGSAQIPNAGFEEWSTGSGTNEPAGWRTFNALGSLFDLTFAEQGSSAPLDRRMLAMDGRVLRHGHDDGTRTPIDTGALASGAYLLQTIGGGSMGLMRFVKG